MYFSPGPHSEFLTKFSGFLSNLVLSTGKLIIIGDFNIHVDVDNDSLSTLFISLLDSTGFSQTLNKPIHRLDHILDLLTYGIVIFFPQNAILSHHYLIFEFLFREYMLLDKNVFTRFLADSAVVSNSMPCLNTTEDSYANISHFQIDNLVDCVAGSL